MTNHQELMWNNGYVSAAEAAEATGRNLSTIHRWVQGGKVEGARSARRLFVSVDSLAKLFESNSIIRDRVLGLRR